MIKSCLRACKHTKDGKKSVGASRAVNLFTFRSDDKRRPFHDGKRKAFPSRRRRSARRPNELFLIKKRKSPLIERRKGASKRVY